MTARSMAFAVNLGAGFPNQMIPESYRAPGATAPRIADGRATPHGVAAALKAYQPPGVSLWQRAKATCAARSEMDGGDPDEPEDVAGYIDHAGWKRIDQRAARKVRNARKARRGWA